MSVPGGLAEALLAERPREKSGGPTGNRFAYQRTWALCQLLRLHEATGDYALIMEFHDDVLVLDSSTDPKAAEFFQLKTLANKMWKQKALLAVPKKSVRSRSESDATSVTGTEAEGGHHAVPRSILGKLVDHVVRFGASQVRTLNVVSNAKFDIAVAAAPPSQEREKTCLAELAAEAIAEIRAKLKVELALDEEPALENIYLLSSGMSLTEHAKHGAGELAAFLDRRKPGGRFAVQALYRALGDELARRTHDEWQPTSFMDLCKRRGIDRNDMELFLRAAEDHFDPPQQLAAVKDQLAREGVAYRELLLLEQAWRRYQVERMDESNATVQALQSDLLSVLEGTVGAAEWSALKELVQSVLAAYLVKFGPPPFDGSYLEGAILFELKFLETRQIQATGSEHASGAR